jgi:hypothetical protein
MHYVLLLVLFFPSLTLSLSLSLCATAAAVVLALSLSTVFLAVSPLPLSPQLLLLAYLLQRRLELHLPSLLLLSLEKRLPLSRLSSSSN